MGRRLTPIVITTAARVGQSRIDSIKNKDILILFSVTLKGGAVTRCNKCYIFLRLPLVSVSTGRLSGGRGWDLHCEPASLVWHFYEEQNQYFFFSKIQIFLVSTCTKQQTVDPEFTNSANGSKWENLGLICIVNKIIWLIASHLILQSAGQQSLEPGSFKSQAP